MGHVLCFIVLFFIVAGCLRDEVILIIESVKDVYDNQENPLHMNSTEKHLGGQGWMGRPGKKGLKSKHWKTLTKNEK